MADTATTDGLTTWRMTGGTRSIAFIDRTQITFGVYSNVILGVHCGVVFGLDTKMSMAYKQDFPLDYDTKSVLGKGVLSEWARAQNDYYFGKFSRAISTIYNQKTTYKLSEYSSMGEISESIKKDDCIYGMHRKVISGEYRVTSKAMKLKIDYGVRFRGDICSVSCKLTEMKSDKNNKNLGLQIKRYIETGEMARMANWLKIVDKKARENWYFRKLRPV